MTRKVVMENATQEQIHAEAEAFTKNEAFSVRLELEAKFKGKTFMLIEVQEGSRPKAGELDGMTKPEVIVAMTTAILKFNTAVRDGMFKLIRGENENISRLEFDTDEAVH